jgi:hypothetical protein
VIERRTFIGTLAGGLLAAPVAAAQQQAGKVWRIGFISLNSDTEPYKRWHAAFHEGLRCHRYCAGRQRIFC